MNRFMLPSALATVFALHALSGCSLSTDVDEVMRNRTAYQRSLSERLSFTNATREVGGFESDTMASMPSFKAVTVPLNITPGTPFEIRLQPAGVAAGAHIEVFGAGERFRTTDMRFEGTFAPFDIDGDVDEDMDEVVEEGRADPCAEECKLLLRMNLFDDQGTAGPGVVLPIAVDDRVLPGLVNATILFGAPSPVESLDFSFERLQLAAGHANGDLAIWAQDQPAIVLQRIHQGQVFSVVSHEDTIISAGRDGFVRATAIAGDRLWEQEFHPGAAIRALAGRNGRFVSGGRNGRLVFFDANGTSQGTLALEFPVNDIAFVDDDIVVVGGGRLALEGNLVLVDLRTQAVVGERRVDDEVSAVATDDVMGIAAAIGRSEVRVYDRNLDAFSIYEDAPSDTIEDLVFRRGQLASATSSGVFNIWQMDGTLLNSSAFVTPTGALVSDGERFAFGAEGGLVWFVGQVEP